MQLNNTDNIRNIEPYTENCSELHMYINYIILYHAYEPLSLAVVDGRGGWTRIMICHVHVTIDHIDYVNGIANCSCEP